MADELLSALIQSEASAFNDSCAHLWMKQRSIFSVHHTGGKNPNLVQLYEHQQAVMQVR